VNAQTPGGAGSETPSLLIKEEHDGVLLLTITTNQIDDSNADHLRTELEEAASAGSPPRVVLNLERVDYLSSAALGVFIAYRQGIDRQGGELRLCGLQNNIAQVFRLTKLNLAFGIHADADSALASF